MDSTALGVIVRNHRLNSGLTQAATAAAAQLSVRALRDIEQGRVTRPHPPSLRRLAKALCLSPEETGRLCDTDPWTAKPLRAGGVEVSLLGPLTLTRHGSPIVITSPAQQHLLGLLALEWERYVSAEEIAEVIWRGQAGPRWRARVHGHISGLRRLLEPRRRSRSARSILPKGVSGYRLELPAEQIDAGRFQRRLAAAAMAGPQEAGEAIGLYQEALECWRGPVLAGADGRLSARPAAEALHRSRVAATLAAADLAASHGMHGKAIGWLRPVAAIEPLHEGVQSRLMIALATHGEQEKALLLYMELRTRLAEHLGVDPAPQTQAAYREVLRMSAAEVQQPLTAPGLVPAQLPMAIPLFTGRDDAVDLIASELIRPPRPGAVPTPRIVVVHGMPGIGKTALALQAAHRVRKHYADGQLFADLRGETGHPRPVPHVLGEFLRALGIPDRDLPAGTDERSALLRSTLAGRRVLILLDDAESAKQVLPLLGSDAGNDLIITSRHPLAEVPAVRHRLTPLDAPASVALLAHYLPGHQVEAESPAAAEVAEHCAGLPLALTIAASLAQGGETLADVARALRDAGHRVQSLSKGDTGIHRVLHSGYLGLGEHARTALRRLAAMPGQSFTSWTVQALLDTNRLVAEQMLRELSNANLVSPIDGVSAPARRYTLHDLVRLHVRSLAEPHDTAAVDHAVLAWLYLADSAMCQLTNRSLPLTGLGLPAWRSPTPLADDNPQAWFDGERSNLLEALRHSAENGRPRVAAGLLNALVPHLRANHLTDDWQEAVQIVLSSARQAGDSLALAYAHDALVVLNVVTAQNAEGLTAATRGLELSGQAGFPRGRQQFLYALQHFNRRLGDIPAALKLCRELIATASPDEDAPVVAATHQALGVIHRHYLNDLPAARHHLEHALRLTADTAKREYSQICYSLGAVYIHQDRADLAEPLLANALKVMRASDNAVGVANVLTLLSEIRVPSDADAALTEALALATATGHREVAAQIHEARSRLCERMGDTRESLLHLRKAAGIYESLAAPWELTRIAAQLSRLEQRRDS
jgi:DNA-binding SARP family transcriptional activator/tetratricopeptide (TPR) repeat protein